MEAFWFFVFCAAAIPLHWLSARADMGRCIISTLLCFATALATVFIWAVAVEFFEGSENAAYAGLAALLVVAPTVFIVFPLCLIAVRSMTGFVTMHEGARRLIVIGTGCLIAMMSLFLLGFGTVNAWEFAALLAPLVIGWTVYVMIMDGNGKGGPRPSAEPRLTAAERNDLGMNDNE